MKLMNLKLYMAMTMIIATTTIEAQIIFLGGGFGGGTFGMNSVKEYNQTILKQLPFKPAIKENFPPFFVYKAEIIYCLPDNLSVAINVTSTSTGSRLSLADYSGKYTLDNIQKGLFTGVKLLYGTGLKKGYLNGLNLSMEGGAAFSKMNISEELNVGTESQNDKMDLNATGFYVQPGACYFLNLTKQFKVCANISYYYGIEKGYHLPNNRKQILYNQESGSPVKPQWDGIRLGITAYWNLRSTKK